MFSRMHPLFSLVVLVSLVGSVSALDDICNFDGAVSLNSSDLASFTSDQFGCALQRISGGWDMIIISFAILIVLLLVYGLYGRNKR